jgi:hypothetical protein
MVKNDSLRVQHLPMCQRKIYAALFATVERITKYRTPDGRHMDPYLVRSPSLYINLCQACSCQQPFNDVVGTNGILTTYLNDRHLPAMYRMSPDGPIYTVSLFFWRCLQNCKILFFYLPLLKRRTEMTKTLLILRNDHKAGGVLVQPMDNAWSSCFLTW